jgi:hypothetical protein
MDAVHQCEGTVNDVAGDGIMAMLGAPVTHDEHAVRACGALTGRKAISGPRTSVLGRNAVGKRQSYWPARATRGPRGQQGRTNRFLRSFPRPGRPNPPKKAVALRCN